MGCFEILSHWGLCWMPIENKTNKQQEALSGTYHKRTGRHQQLCDLFLSNMKNEVNAHARWDWRAPDKKHWTLLNAAAGLYYGFYNDGDNAESAVQNRRANGFDHVHDLKVFSKKMGANHLVDCTHTSGWSFRYNTFVKKTTMVRFLKRPWTRWSLSYTLWSITILTTHQERAQTLHEHYKRCQRFDPRDRVLVPLRRFQPNLYPFLPNSKPICTIAQTGHLYGR